MDLFGEEPTIEENPAPGSIAPDEAPEEFGHPRTMQFCLGHGTVEKKLLENFNADRLPHGLIFSGPKGIGKATMAYRFAKFLLKHGATNPNQEALFGDDDAPAPATFDISPDEQAARLVTSGGHPDLMSVERIYDAAKNRYKAGVEVAEIRKVAPFLRMTAADGGWRVVIIDDADTMNRNAQNALLKILEEPPKNTILILVAHRLGTLIPTIRSRTQFIHFRPLPQDILQELLTRKGQGFNVEELDTFTHLSSGSFGKILQYVEEGGLDTLEKIISIFQSYPDWDWPEIHIIADSLGGKGQDQEFQNFQELLQWVFAQLTLAKARGQGIQSAKLNIEVFQSLLKNSSLERLLKICENLHSHFNRANVANLDKRQAVLGAFSLITL